MAYKKSQIKSLNKDINKYFPFITPIQNNFKITSNAISRLVMLDRYSQKDTQLKTLKIGDLVISIIKHNVKFPTRGIGYVKKINLKNQTAEIELESGYKVSVGKKELSKNGTITRKIEEIAKPLEIYWEQIATRVGTTLSEPEKSIDDKIKWASIFTKELISMKILPAGRVLYGAGSQTNVTYFNCYVMPYIQDSRGGISDHRKKVMEIMSRGGGVGTNGSTLRPRNAIAKGVGGKSSGSVSWLNDLANLTNLVEQGGSRRGAQMIMLADWHPDIIEFIISKMQKPEVLLWLSKNSKDSLIRKIASEKIELRKLADQELESYKYIKKNPLLFSKNTVYIAEERLKENGTWTVTNPEFLAGANISIAISDEFMEAVKKNKKWTLKFPDIDNYNDDQKKWYNEKWSKYGDVREWKALGFKIKKYYTLNAIDLWDLINFCATYSAEPGVFFIDTANKDTNAKAYNQKVVATNPCGEQPLAPFSVCNLAALNLSKFVDRKTGKILYDDIKNTTKICVRLQDNVIDKTPYFLKENEEQALGERRVGLGIMGLHDLFIWANIKYGSSKSIKVVDKIMNLIAISAYEESIELAKTKGSFPLLKNRDVFVQTGFVSKLPSYIKMNILKYGIRNSHLLTIAPTGTTGTLANVSTGLEPYFGFTYYRSGRLGQHIKVESDIVTEFKKNHPNITDKKFKQLFVKASDLSPKQHAQVQITIQKWVDSSISKTVNAPSSYTVKQVEGLYMYLYDGKAKGGTVYVDGSRSAQVLSLTKPSSKGNIKNNVDEEKRNSSIISEDTIINVQDLKDDAEIKEFRGNRQDREIGVSLGNICPNCHEGIVVERGGCTECSNCNAQLKCGL